MIPAPGNCGLYLEHLLNNVYAGDEEFFNWLLGWMADTVQNPSQRPGTAVVLRGKQGTGKTIACTEFGKLLGPHFRVVAQSRHLLGNFNAHLEGTLVLLAEEAVWAGDKPGASVLKDLITGDTVNIERKGVDVQRSRNLIHLMISRNSDWVVPAGPEERRFAVFDVSDGGVPETKCSACGPIPQQNASSNPPRQSTGES